MPEQKRELAILMGAISWWARTLVLLVWCCMPAALTYASKLPDKPMESDVRTQIRNYVVCCSTMFWAVLIDWNGQRKNFVLLACFTNAVGLLVILFFAATAVCIVNQKDNTFYFVWIVTEMEKQFSISQWVTFGLISPESMSSATKVAGQTNVAVQYAAAWRQMWATMHDINGGSTSNNATQTLKWSYNVVWTMLSDAMNHNIMNWMWYMICLPLTILSVVVVCRQVFLIYELYIRGQLTVSKILWPPDDVIHADNINECGCFNCDMLLCFSAVIVNVLWWWLITGCEETDCFRTEAVKLVQSAWDMLLFTGDGSASSLLKKLISLIASHLTLVTIRSSQKTALVSLVLWLVGFILFAMYGWVYMFYDLVVKALYTIYRLLVPFKELQPSHTLTQ